MTDKGKILAFPDTAAIEADAAAWVARFDAGEVSAKDQAAFQEWLNRSALHREAVAEYGNLWTDFDALRQLTDVPAAEAGARDDHPALLKQAAPWLAACAAAVTLAVGGTVFFHPRPQPPILAKAEHRSAAPLFYETAIGGHERVILADGSSVVLNTNSRVNVEFTGNRRDIHLVRGEAYFEVVHDKTRPFTVYANNYVVRDIGTAFDVHLQKAGLVEVRVTKGSVEVAPASSAQAADDAKSLGILVAGHDIVLGQKVERAEVVSSADMGRKLAWRQGQLIYTGQPLGEVLADISRYSDIKIELADPALASLPVGGAFRTDQIEAIFTALENNFGIHAEWTDPQHVRFTSGREKPVSRD
jgi:transmembrane sensor